MYSHSLCHSKGYVVPDCRCSAAANTCPILMLARCQKQRKINVCSLPGLKRADDLTCDSLNPGAAHSGVVTDNRKRPPGE